MTIVEPARFIAGLVILLVGLAFLWQSRGTRGFNQRRQTGVVALGGGGVLVALGLGWLDFGNLLG